MRQPHIAVAQSTGIRTTGDESLQGAASPADYENETVFQRHRLPPRSYYIPRNSLLLNGLWDFNYAPSPANAPEPKSDTVSRHQQHVWAPIEVPGNWQLQGYGRPHYTNINYPFPVCPPRVPTDNPTGTYRRGFFVPIDWPSDSQIRLRFDGVDSAFHLWVNGSAIGYSQGSRNPSEFDVTKVVSRYASNDILVRVYQWSDGSYIEDQDMWWLSGIFRDVHLISFPSKARVNDFFIQTLLDEKYEHATLNVTLDLALLEAGKVAVSLWDPQNSGTALAQCVSNVDTSHNQHVMSLHVRYPQKWTAESPFLYDLDISVFLGDSHEEVQNIRHRVGFRKVELKSGLISVNGVPLFLRGVNRHDHHPHRGRAVSMSFVRQDLLLMKKHNINAIRTSHYPSHPALPGLADELGFWIIDEADLECHGFGNCPDPEKWASDNPSWRAAYLDRIQQLIHRDKNHPSVVIWSLGNESFYGMNHAAMYKYAKKFDPGRLVHYCDDHEARTADIYSSMYLSIEDLKRRATECGDDFEKPVILCEYAHAMGNSPGSLKEYQATFREHRRLQGGFVWEWANHGLWVKAKNGKPGFYAYGGDFGDVPNDGNFVMDGLCYSNHTPTPGLLELKKAIEPVVAWVEDDNLVVRNEYDFIGLDHLTVIFKVELFKDEAAIVRCGEIDMPSIASGQKARIKLPKGLLDKSYGAETWLTITFSNRVATTWADSGHEVAWCQHRLEELRYVSIPASFGTSLQVNTSKTYYQVSGAAFSFLFNRVHGNLLKWTANGKTLFETLNGVPPSPAIRLSFWRPPTDNDLRTVDGYFRGAGLNVLTSQLRSFSLDRDSEGRARIFAHLRIAPPVQSWGFDVKLTYLVLPSGSLHIHVKANPTGPAPDQIPRVGFDVRLHPSFNTATWFGLGPGESYPDKQLAQKVGIYSAPLEALHTPYEMPQENGNHVETRWLKMLDAAGAGFKASRMNASFQWAASQYSPENIDLAQHPPDLVADDTTTYLRLDAEGSGVGSGACGPRTRDEYQVKTEVKEFEFKLEPISG